MDKNKNTVGLLSKENQKENINIYNKYAFGIDSMQEDLKNILKQPQQSTNVLSSIQQNHEINSKQQNISSDQKSNKFTTQRQKLTSVLTDRELVGRNNRQTASLEKDVKNKRQDYNVMANNQNELEEISVQKYEIPIRRHSQKPSICSSSNQVKDNQWSSNILQTPRCKEENTSTINDSLGKYMSSQKKSKLQASPSDIIVQQYDCQFPIKQDIKENNSNYLKQKYKNTLLENKNSSIEALFNKNEFDICDDKFKNPDVFLQGSGNSIAVPLVNQKTQNYYCRAQTSEQHIKNQNQDLLLKKDSKTIDVESNNSQKYKIDNFSSKKNKINSSKQQKSNSQKQQSDKVDFDINKIKIGVDSANVTFYPKQSPVNNNSFNQNNDLKRDQDQGSDFEQKQRNSTDSDENIQQQSISQSKTLSKKNTIDQTFGTQQEDKSKKNINGKGLQKNQYVQNELLNQQFNSITFQEQQHNYPQKQQSFFDQQQLLKSSQISGNILQQFQNSQPSSNAILNNNKQFQNENKQFEQLEQKPLNQMKFHNLYQKNISQHQKNNTKQQQLQYINQALVTPMISEKNSIGVNLFETDQFQQQNNSINYSNNQLLILRNQQQLNQQRALNQICNFKRQIQIHQNQQQQKQLSQRGQVGSNHHRRSNSHHVDNINSNKNSCILMNYYDQAINDLIQQDLQYMNGRERCNISVDQIIKNDLSYKNYSDNKINLSMIQQDNLAQYKKKKCDIPSDILTIVNTAKSSLYPIQPSTSIHHDNSQHSNLINYVQHSTYSVKQQPSINQISKTIQIPGISGNDNSISTKKENDICLPSLDQQLRPKNLFMGCDSKNVNQNKLKIQQSQKQQQQPFQQGFEKINFQTLKNVTKINKNLSNNLNQDFEDKSGVFGIINLNNQRNEFINQQFFLNINQKMDQSQNSIIKMISNTVQLNEGSSKKSIDQVFNQEVQNKGKTIDQILESTGRFGQEQISESQSDKQKGLDDINLNQNLNQRNNYPQPSNINSQNQINLSSIKIQRNSLSGDQTDITLGNAPQIRKQSQSQHQSSGMKQDYGDGMTIQNQFSKQFDQNQIQFLNNNQKVSIQKQLNKQNSLVGSAPIYNNSAILVADSLEHTSNLNAIQHLNIPVITTNMNQNINRLSDNNFMNQGTLLINYNFPVQESLQYDRSKLSQQQQQLIPAKNQSNNQKKISSAITYKRKDDQNNISQQNDNENLDLSQQRAKSSNNRFPRDIFTPNVQKAKRLNNQNKQNINCCAEDKQNENYF